MIYIIRHGQTDWNIEHRTQGHTDIALNKNGIEQTELIIQKIANLKIDNIISSDLKRAYMTAQIINKKFNKTIEEDKRLREFCFGTLEGITEEYKGKSNFKQISNVFLGKVIEDTKQLNVTQKEKDEGAKLLWETPEKALELITDCYDKLVKSDYESVYATRFVVLRDRKILEYYNMNDFYFG